VETVLQLAAYATPGGAVLVVLLVVWVGIDNIRALLWFNTQAEQPAGRFGLLPFVAASLLYLGVLALYVWNDGVLQLLPGLNLDPLVLLLPAVVTSWLCLRYGQHAVAGGGPQLHGAGAAAAGHAVSAVCTGELRAAHPAAAAGVPGGV
jgi:hypothetical protein